MTSTVYWLLFALVAVVLLVAVPALARQETRRAERERESARRLRRERSEQARRRIRLGL